MLALHHSQVLGMTQTHGIGSSPIRATDASAPPLGRDMERLRIDLNSKTSVKIMSCVRTSHLKGKSTITLKNEGIHF